ncbi:protoheme IX farnesyltransferase [Sneathiella sp. DP05]|uniref:Protoheme IX farnesyltransferase n=1 Tax=Sneathiella litorea TaxID=2606216 RepID=A0A6L8W3S5_9PROT|nr:protoheme IX farnesyltransferase [Sneathiella litorea]
MKETIETRAHSDLARVSDYFALLKPRVMSLVVFTGLVGLVVAPGEIHPVLAFTALLCIAIGAGASGAINMWYDADIDAVMERTKERPIPAGRVSASEALAFGTVLSVASVVLMGLAINYVAAALLALTIGFYVFIYSMWLKRRTPQNIVIGGAAGAFPPMIGWAAVTGDVSAESLVLFAIIFMWTPPHFWALSLWRDIDYAKAGVPMLPVVAGRDVTRRQIVLYSVLLCPVAVMPYFLGYAGAVYGIGATLLSGLFLLLALKVWRSKDEESAKQLFAFSLLYLFLIFATLLGENLIRTVI